MKRLLLTVALILLISSQAHAERSYSDISYGLGLFYGLNSYNSSFSNLEGIDNCCAVFQSGTGLGPSGEVFMDIRLSGISYLSLRVSYHDISGEFEESQYTSIDFNNEIYSAKISHEINTYLHLLGFEPHLLLIYNRLSLFAGLGFGMYISDDFNQAEYLIEPTNYGTFENGKRVRNEVEGSIPALSSFAMYFSIGAGYEFNLNYNGSLRLRPEIQFKSSTFSVINSDRWNFSKLLFGLKLKFNALSGFDSPLVPEDD